MQIKPQWDTTTMAIIKKTIKCWFNVEKMEPLYTASGTVNGMAALENRSAVS